MTDLCQKCADGVGKVLGLDMVKAIADVRIVPEVECQQWAHGVLNKARRVIADEFGEPGDDAQIEELASWR